MNQELLGFQNDFSQMAIGKSGTSAHRQALRNAVASSQRAQFEKRFSIYRNNVHNSLIRALADTFPVVQQLVGEKFFAMMATEYLQSFPPKLAVLLEFGSGFADFVQSFKPAESLHYLGDVATLEYAWQESYHSEDAASAGADYFAGIQTEELYARSLTCHPSLRLVNSDFAVGSIWQSHQGDQGRSEDPFSGMSVDKPEWLAVVRPEYHVQIWFLDEPGFQFIEQLGRGTPLGETTGELAEHFQDWDPAQTLAFAIQSGFFVSQKI